MSPHELYSFFYHPCLSRTIRINTLVSNKGLKRHPYVLLAITYLCCNHLFKLQTLIQELLVNVIKQQNGRVMKELYPT